MENRKVPADANDRDDIRRLQENELDMVTGGIGSPASTDKTDPEPLANGTMNAYCPACGHVTPHMYTTDGKLACVLCYKSN